MLFQLSSWDTKLFGSPISATNFDQRPKIDVGDMYVGESLVRRDYVKRQNMEYLTTEVKSIDMHHESLPEAMNPNSAVFNARV